MRCGQFSGLLFVLLGCSVLAGQEAEKFVSGPKPGTMMPGPFECYNVNGEAKGRRHCLVCEFALNPSVLIFAREPAAEKDKALNELLHKLEEAVQEFGDQQFSAGVVFLSPDARDSTNATEEQKSAQGIIDEAVKRQNLVKRLEKRVEDLKLKHVVVGSYPAEGPKKYNIHAMAEVTVLFYDRLKVVKNWAYASEKMQGEDVAGIVKEVREKVEGRKKE